MDIREWTIVYVRHRDLIARKLQTVDEKDDCVIFTFKDYELVAYPMEQLSLPPHAGKTGGKTLITTHQTKANVDALIKGWKSFAAVKDLTVIFVNLSTNEKWLIHPHTHAQIADTNLEGGIRSIADGVTYM
ncbi:TPA: hypothetical protein HA251_05560 [Candidatus Woesearchaeota archaeon]|nr:hypothetical protein [Candidatus Woesearchaeota archaeon]